MLIRNTKTRIDESVLSHVPSFEGLSLGQIREILDQAVSGYIEDGETIFEEAQPARRFYILLDGHIRVVRHTADGDQVIVAYIPPGELFGIARAIRRETYPATAIAASDCIILSWPTALFDEFSANYKGFAAEAYRMLGERLTERNDRLISMATQKVEQRIALALFALSERSGRPVEEGMEIAFPISRQDLSEMTATTLYTASRAMSKWEKEGIIRTLRKRILVCDQERLRLLATGGNEI